LGRNWRKEEFVTPGDRLGVVEEFYPGPGTYEVDGVIFSKFVGVAVKDPLNKRIHVSPSTKKAPFPNEGDVVLGAVANVQEKAAILSLFSINGRLLFNPLTGILHISASSLRFERSMVDVCKATDIVRARVMNMRNRVPQLTTAGRMLGVIAAYCSSCGSDLTLKSKKGTLQCGACGNVERRKVADDYGLKPVRFLDGRS